MTAAAARAEIAEILAGAAARAQVRRETEGRPATQAAALRLVEEFPALERMGRLRRWVWWARAVAALARAGWADRDAPAPAAAGPAAAGPESQAVGR